jgi:hypothetical protein
VIISIELSDEDWRIVCEALEARSLDAESDMEANLEEEDTLEYCIQALADCERIDGYITTIVGNAMERARPRFSEN